MGIPLKPLFSRYKRTGVQFTDEPTGNLDSRTFQDVLGLLKVFSKKYNQTEVGGVLRKKRKTKRAGIVWMAFANLWRNKKKTLLVFASLSVSILLFSIMLQFTSGFSMEKYLEKSTYSDFIVGKSDYFRFAAFDEESGITEEMVKEIQENTEIERAGRAWSISGNVPQKGIRIEGEDEALIEKLTVLKGDVKALNDPNANAIAVPVATDDYGNPENLDDYPKLGEKISITYAQKSNTVEYTVCALVTIPYQISFRSRVMDCLDLLMGTEQLRKDSHEKLYALFYMFDTPNQEKEAVAESFLATITGDKTSELMYESKAIVRQEFQRFQQMFVILGSVLCIIVGIAIFVAVIFIFLGSPFLGKVLESTFWFFEYHFQLLAVWIMAPILLVMGILLPLVVYKTIEKKSIMERLREVGE